MMMIWNAFHFSKKKKKKKKKAGLLSIVGIRAFIMGWMTTPAEFRRNAPASRRRPPA